MSAVKYNIGDRIKANICVDSFGAKTIQFDNCSGRQIVGEKEFVIIHKTKYEYIVLVDDKDLHAWKISTYDGTDSKWIGFEGWYITDKFIRDAEPKTRCKICRYE